eukprot:TRINITY_DN47284_c0_g2_i1.p2 TRINITY_DN47284_c0_g2~~TRINITY_DN47284_c0_g2_i1.p2  ORF type:complete len:133 (+),score=25.23 TRINITY_DN47284_c0_g2_i1:169-567(+)
MFFHVATADDDIHEAIVQDALRFAESRVQAVSRILMTGFEKPANSESDTHTDAIMNLEKDLFHLRLVLADWIESEAKMGDWGEVGEPKISKATRRKVKKKLSQAEVVLVAISGAIRMRACRKLDVVAIWPVK